jgi:transposase
MVCKTNQWSTHEGVCFGMKIPDVYLVPDVTQEELRVRMIRAILDGRKRQVEVAAIFGVTRQAVSKWVEVYRKEGEKALKRKRAGRPKDHSLLPFQAAQIRKMIVDCYPEQLKLPFYLWTREAVAQLIERKFGIRFSIRTVGQYLRGWGFTAQEPVLGVAKKNREGMRHWLEEEYPAIQTQAKREGAVIYWGDEVKLHNHDPSGCPYQCCSDTLVIPIAGQRSGCRILSAVTNKRQVSFMAFNKCFHSEVFTEFLGRLVLQNIRKIFLIMDSPFFRYSTEMRTWRRENFQWIRLFFLPGHSAELNPDEVVRQNVINNKFRRYCDANQ